MNKYIAVFIGAVTLIFIAMNTRAEFDGYAVDKETFCTDTLPAEYAQGALLPEALPEIVSMYTRHVLEAPTENIRSRAILLSLAYEYGTLGKPFKLRALQSVCFTVEEIE